MMARKPHEISDSLPVAEVVHEPAHRTKAVPRGGCSAHLLLDVIDAITAFEVANAGKPATRLFLPRTLAWDLARLPASEVGSLFHDLVERGPSGLKQLYGCPVTLTTEDTIRVE